MSETTSPASILSVVRRAYPGNAHGLSDSGFAFSVESGATKLRLSSATIAIAPKTRMAASTSQRPARSRRALIETGGRIFICRPRDLIGRQLGRLHAPRARHSEKLLLRAGKKLSLQSGECGNEIHSNLLDLLRSPLCAKSASIARVLRLGVKRSRRCRRVESRARRATRQASKPSFWRVPAGQEGMGCRDGRAGFATARKGQP